MILFWLLWLSLVLGGVAGFLAVRGGVGRLWLRVARVPARARRPVWQAVCATDGRRLPWPVASPGDPWPPFRVAPRAGPPFRPRA